jgi:Cu/Ag efflux pump CusA
MKSLAFILGCLPLMMASGSGAAGRQILGTVVVTSMLAATALAILVIPVLFVLLQRSSSRARQGPGKSARVTMPSPVPAKGVD